MAPAPIFVSDLSELKKRLRLTGLASGSDAESILFESLLASRVLFIQRFGAVKVAELAALPFVESPSSDEEALAALAWDTEVLIVQRELLNRLPYMGMDVGGDAFDAWNEEAPFRDLTSDQRTELERRLSQRIESNFNVLAAGQITDQQGLVRAETIVNECLPNGYLQGSSAYLPFSSGLTSQ